MLVAIAASSAGSASDLLVQGEIPQNPATAPNGRSYGLNDSYASQTYPWSGPVAQPTAVTHGLADGTCISSTIDGLGRILAFCATGRPGSFVDPRLELFDPVTLERLSSLALPPKSHFYLQLTASYRALVPANRDLWIVDQVDVAGATRLVRTHTIRLGNHLGRRDRLVAVALDWDGRIWFVTVTAVVGYVDPASGNVAVIRLPRGERVSNGLSTDETRGVFVATDRALYRFDRQPETGNPVVTWREVYDAGSRTKPGQLVQGTGTTPTLMGSSYVTIADNADPFMHVLIFRRSADPTQSRLVCSVPVFGENEGATDNSLIATPTAVVVENNYGYVDAGSVTGGLSTAPGITRIDLDPITESCTVAWSSQERAPNALPKLSLVDGRIYTYTKDPDPIQLIDRWDLTAIDFATGETIYKVPAGEGSAFDSNYSVVTVGPDGTLYVGITDGIVSFRP